MLWQRVSSLTQSEDKIIAAYLKQMKNLFRKLSASLSIIEFNMMWEMQNLNKQSWIIFKYIKDQNYTFSKVKKNIIAVY